MGLQTPGVANPNALLNSVLNPSVSNQGTALQSPASSSANSLPQMTQLPNIPPPPFLNAKSMGNSDLSASLPDIPPPSSLLNPGVGTTTSSVPASSSFLDPLPEIPPPHMVAPYVYAQFPKAAPPQIFQPQTPPQPPAVPQQPQQQSPTQPVPRGPEENPVEKGKKTKQSAEVDKGVLTDDVINRLNRGLNSESSMTRLDAAGDLLALMQRNPKLEEDPTYKPYIDAFVDKILADPSEMVRMPGLMMLQLGLSKTPTQYTQNRVQELADKQKNADPSFPDTGESGMANTILEKLSNPASSVQSKGVTPSGENPNAGTGMDSTLTDGIGSSLEAENPMPELPTTDGLPTNQNAGATTPGLTNNTQSGTTAQAALGALTGAQPGVPAAIAPATSPVLTPSTAGQANFASPVSTGGSPISSLTPQTTPQNFNNAMQALTSSPGGQLNLTSPAQQMAASVPQAAGQHLNLMEGR